MNLTSKGYIFDADTHTLQVKYSESSVINLLRTGNERAFERIFKDHFKNLHAYAYTFLKDSELAEEAVQNVFCRIWEKKDLLKDGGSIKAYLYMAVHNECLNYLKHQKVKTNFQVYYAGHMEQSEEPTAKKVMVAELEKHIHLALNALPQQCRTIFQLSRFEQLKYQQIADQLGLSIKTVENQMGKALKILRVKLAEFLPVAFILIIQYLYE